MYQKCLCYTDFVISKEDSELSSLTEKLVRFDVRFRVRNPKLSSKTICVSLHIGLEAQLTYRPKRPSYPILKRAVYYVARDLSSQLITVTTMTDYSKLEKCYSIWICTKDIPKKQQNTMTEYSFMRVGDFAFGGNKSSGKRTGDEIKRGANLI